MADTSAFADLIPAGPRGGAAPQGAFLDLIPDPGLSAAVPGAGIDPVTAMLLDQAREAVRKGADPKAVAQRLRDLGVDLVGAAA